MEISLKAKAELKQILNTTYKKDFTDEDLNEIGIFLLTALSESLKLKTS